LTKIQLQVTDYGPQIDVANSDQLDHLLDELTIKTDPETPTIIYVYPHGYKAGLGIGSEKSFVTFEQEIGDLPYLITVGDPSAPGVQPFYLFDIHNTEVPKHNLIPIEKARNILREWIQGGVLSKSLNWEEV
jgi:DNA-directed RNA polymerase subunit H (RpoH/RPB5)